MSKDEMLFDIATVERETGIGKDALRVWERRYGFPSPVRDERDERLYPQSQLDQLRLIKLLLGNGMRPSKVVGLGLDELNTLLVPRAASATLYAEDSLRLLEQIKSHQAQTLKIMLSCSLLRQGLYDFLSKTITPLNQLIGEAWMRGEIRIFEEHLYSDQITNVLRTAIATMRDSNGTPRVLLTTLPGEEHALGLLMVEALLSMHGASCVTLGVQTPIPEIGAAASAHHSDIVVLSFSEASSMQQVRAGLQQAYPALPSGVELWAGGAGVMRLRNPVDGVSLMGPLSDVIDALKRWREASQVAPVLVYP